MLLKRIKGMVRSTLNSKDDRQGELLGVGKEPKPSGNFFEISNLSTSVFLWGSIYSLHCKIPPKLIQIPKTARGKASAGEGSFTASAVRYYPTSRRFSRQLVKLRAMSP